MGSDLQAASLDILTLLTVVSLLLAPSVPGRSREIMLVVLRLLVQSYRAWGMSGITKKNLGMFLGLRQRGVVRSLMYKPSSLADKDNFEF